MGVNEEPGLFTAESHYNMDKNLQNIHNKLMMDN